MKHFTLTTEHIALLQAMEVGWQDTEFGAPEIDPKRPYGNSDVIPDIHEILTGGEETWPPDSRTEEAELRERYARLHRETETALQVVLRAGLDVAPGNYEANDYGSDWRLV